MSSVLKYLSLKTKFGIASVLILVIVLVNCALGWYWSQEPDIFNVKTVAETRALGMGVQDYSKVEGFVTTSTIITIGETLLNKPGGYLTNDVTPPSILLDNMPSWEYGALVQLRDFTESMREDLSRSQSQSTENKDLGQAEPKLKFDNNSWMFPPTESEYKDGLKQMGDYILALTQSTQDSRNRARFYARADNLKNLLDHASKRLGSISQRLSASVGQRYINADIAEEVGIKTEQPMNVISDEGLINQTPWLEIDNVFYEARGATWALLHLLKAVEVDFNDVLRKKAATASLKQIIRELEATQETLWSPMVLNGKGMGLLANHSLVMANYVSRANTAIIDLKTLLEQG